MVDPMARRAFQEAEQYARFAAANGLLPQHRPGTPAAALAPELVQRQGEFELALAHLSAADDEAAHQLPAVRKAIGLLAAKLVNERPHQARQVSERVHIRGSWFRSAREGWCSVGLAWPVGWYMWQGPDYRGQQGKRVRRFTGIGQGGQPVILHDIVDAPPCQDGWSVQRSGWVFSEGRAQDWLLMLRQLERVSASPRSTVPETDCRLAGGTISRVRDRRPRA